MIKYFNRHNFYLRRPITKYIRDIFLRSFSYPVLGTLAATSVFIAFVFKVTFKIREKETLSLSYLLVCVVSIISMQGSPQAPQKFITSSVITIALLFALMSYNVYSASTTSKLSIQLEEIFTPEDLLYDTNLEIGFTPDLEDMLKKSLNPVLREVYKRGMADKEDLVMDASEGIQKALVSSYAILGDQRIFRRAIKKLPRHVICDVSKSMTKSKAVASGIKWHEIVRVFAFVKNPIFI